MLTTFPSAWAAEVTRRDERVEVDDHFDREGDVAVYAHDARGYAAVLLRRPEVERLRDHLTALLGDAPAADDYTVHVRPRTWTPADLSAAQLLAAVEYAKEIEAALR